MFKKNQYYNRICYKNFRMEIQINYKIQQHDCRPNEMDKEAIGLLRFRQLFITGVRYLTL